LLHSVNYTKNMKYGVVSIIRDNRRAYRRQKVGKRMAKDSILTKITKKNVEKHLLWDDKAISNGKWLLLREVVEDFDDITLTLVAEKIFKAESLPLERNQYESFLKPEGRKARITNLSVNTSAGTCRVLILEDAKEDKNTELVLIRELYLDMLRFSPDTLLYKDRQLRFVLKGKVLAVIMVVEGATHKDIDLLKYNFVV